MKNERSLYWTLILYENSENLDFSKKIELIKKQYNYLYIKHDKDLLPTGEIKKSHYHIVLKFKNYKWKNSLSEELDIPPNYLEPVRSLNSILCYLIHFKEETKHHYDIMEVKGSADFKSKLLKVINNIDKTEEDKISILFNYIMISNRKITFSNFVSYVISKGLWSEFRRSSTIFIKLLEEHNVNML